jgi:hypothetical protein
MFVACIDSETAEIMQIIFLLEWWLWSKHPNASIANSESDMLPMALFS